MSGSNESGQPDESLESYGRRARAWVEANLERQSPELGERSGRSSATTIEEIDAGRRLQARIHAAGYAGITWPVEYGGQGLTPEHARLFDEATEGYVLPDLGIAGGATMGVCAPTMLAHASPEFLAAHGPGILSGAEIFVQFFSDPDAGSDLAGVRTTAVRDGDRWILNGSKIWSSGAHYADYGMCLARTDWDAPKHRGLTWFCVPTSAEGVTIEPIRQINGSEEFCQEFFTDVELTDADVIGEVNDGWTVARTMLFFERGGGGLGGGSRPGEPTGVDPAVISVIEAAGRRDDLVARDLVARVHTIDLVRRSLGRRLGELMAADPMTAGQIASYGKLAAGVYDPIRANLLMEIGAEPAVTWTSSGAVGEQTAIGLLDSRFMAIAGGTTQMQRNTIGEQVLGLPREPSFDTRKPFREVVRDAQNWTGAS